MRNHGEEQVQREVVAAASGAAAATQETATFQYGNPKGGAESVGTAMAAAPTSPSQDQSTRSRSVKSVRPYEERDLAALTALWNDVVEAGRAFPQTDPLSLDEARQFFADQTYVGVAEVAGRVVGLYILHPNNVGRCSHVANASYAVQGKLRGFGLGRLLVEDSLRRLAPCGFRGLQFNAVVASNTGARALYESLGFTQVGMIPGGFRNKEGVYEDMYLYYHDAV